MQFSGFEELEIDKSSFSANMEGLCEKFTPTEP